MECRAAAGPSYGFSALGPDELVVRLAARARLHEASAPRLPGGAAVEPLAAAIVSVTTAGRAEAALETDGHAAACAVLAEETSALAADAVAHALAATRAAYTVRSFFCPDPETVAGGETSWLDAGPAGLWLTTWVDDERVHFEPVGPERVLADLLAGLPVDHPPPAAT
ncbi:MULTISPECIES: hypothetical protein [unclassified Frankia]|uniref:hypothetical protein n=1 Tax=unclassified Frankia TaxID=2632575 RepID=UPI001933F1A1|nr:MULTISPECIES: hypothetical protein [unclassified Frankia]MBL7492282.1 hypothetical protein [Frankia sp. AgW1.1]MBL7622572.1 hypothetical protein [Frankia sp. AgB1.8]